MHMSDSTIISVALIEDNRLVRGAISALLHELPDFDVITAGCSAESELLWERPAQVVLLGLGLRNGDSLRMAEVVKAEVPSAKVIVMDVLPGHDDIVDYVKAGVEGFIMRDATLEELAATIRSVAGGVKVLPPQMAASLFSQMASTGVGEGRPVAPDAGRATAREREVIDLIKEGCSNKEIARRLHIATNTVKSHVRNIMEKLALRTRLQISAFAHGDEDF